MGTRGTSGLIINNKEKLSYNVFDSYPSGLGRDVVNLIVFINNENGWEKFRKNAKKLKELKNITSEIIEKYKKYADLNVSNKSYTDPYCLFRKIQGSDWLKEVYEDNLEHFNINNTFIKDSLFCEYGYIINLDTMKLEFYDGYQQKKQENNRFGVEPNADGYYPSRLVGVFDLENIQDVDFMVDKMEKIVDSEKDDSSVNKYFRKDKLKEINESQVN